MSNIKKLAILGTQYAPPYIYGGEQNIIHYLNKHSSSNKCQVDIYTPKFRKWQHYNTVSNTRNVTRIPVNNIRFFYHFQFAKRLPNYLKCPEYDIVLNTHNELGYNLKLRPHIVRVSSVPSIDFADIGIRPIRLLEKFMRIKVAFNIKRKVLHSCDHIICVTSQVKNEVIQFYQIPEKKITIVGNGVDSTYFRPLGNEQNIELRTFRILYVGRLVQRKNVDLLIRAAKILKSKNINFEVHIVGEGEEKTRLMNLTRALRLDGSVFFTGHKSGQELLDEYQSSHIYVLPTLFEGMPNTLLEAQSCGLPSIVYNFQGAKDIIQNDFNGYVLEENSAEELVDRVIHININKKLRLSMKRNAREFILNRFSWDYIIDSYFDLFCRVKEEYQTL